MRLTAQRFSGLTALSGRGLWYRPFGAMSFNAACRRLCTAKVYPHRYRGAPSRGRSQRYVLASPRSHSERQRRISVHAVYESFVIKYQSAEKSRCMQIRKQSAPGCGLSPTCTFRTISKNNIPMIGTPERWDEGSALFLPLFHGSRASGNGWNKARTFRSLYSYSISMGQNLIVFLRTSRCRA